MLPDTHAHLDASAFDGDRDAIVERAREAGIDRILAVGSDLESSLRAVEIAAHHESVYAAVGIHPHDSDRFGVEGEQVRRLLGQKKVVAVGEIGLDYVRAESSREVQREVFRRQLEWAHDAGKPVTVHNRDADDEVLAFLVEAQVRGVLHCFSGTWDFAASALEAGFFLSFAGNLTFPKSAELRDVAGRVPLARVLVETDAPVLAPQPWRGRRNEPAYAVATAAALAEAKKMPVETLSNAVTGTADALFSWRES